MKALEGFHIQFAYQMSRANKSSRHPQIVVWAYLLLALVLKEVGLSTILHCEEADHHDVHYEPTHIRFLQR